MNYKVFFIIVGMIFFSLVNLPLVSALNVVTYIPERYLEVYPGERLYFEVEVRYPENPTRVDLRLNYIIEKDGNVIAESETLKAIETQASFMDFLIIPEDANTSLHNLKIEVIDYGDMKEEFSTNFKLSEKGFDDVVIYFLVTMAIFGLLSILIMVDIFRRRRNKIKNFERDLVQKGRNQK